MGAPSQIHRLDVRTGEINLWKPRLAERFGAIGDITEKPSVSPTGNRVAFATYQDAGAASGRVVVYDEERDHLTTVADSILFIDRITWSDDESYLGFSAVPHGEPIQNYTAYVLDLSTGGMALTVQDNTNYVRLGDLYQGQMLYDSGSWWEGGHSVWEMKYPNGADEMKVYAYNASTEVFESPVYADKDSIYVLVGDSLTQNSAPDVHVCVQSLRSRDRRCITGERKERNSLRILRHMASDHEE